MITTILFVLTLAAVTFPAKWADISMFNNRLALWASGTGLLLAWVCPNPWLAVFIAASSMNLMLRPQPSQPLKDSYYWALALGALAVCAIPFASLVTLQAFLWGLVALGVIQTGYTYWDVNAGQGNPMHVQALAAVATAATVGLALSWPWLWLAVPVIAWPILHGQWWVPQRDDAKLTLGPLYLLACAVGVAYLTYGWIALPGPMVAAAGVFWWAWPKTMIWSGRKEWWTAGVLFWWQRSAWWQKLLGFGADAWILFSQQYIGELAKVSQRPVTEGFEAIVMPHAHNDYVQILFDRGLIGLFALFGYLVTSLLTLAAGGPDAQALFLIGVTLCAIAFGSFPWTGCVMAYIPDLKRLAGYGCPVLNYISWIVIILVEVVRRGA